VRRVDGVGLEDLVDLVEHRVHVLVDRRLAFADGGGGLVDAVRLDLGVLAALASTFLAATAGSAGIPAGHRAPPDRTMGWPLAL
jgi:hypothetical protein